MSKKQKEAASDQLAANMDDAKLLVGGRIRNGSDIETRWGGGENLSSSDTFLIPSSINEDSAQIRVHLRRGSVRALIASQRVCHKDSLFLYRGD